MSLAQRSGAKRSANRLWQHICFQRRVLFGCSLLMVLSLIMWIAAISTDRGAHSLKHIPTHTDACEQFRKYVNDNVIVFLITFHELVSRLLESYCCVEYYLIYIFLIFRVIQNTYVYSCIFIFHKYIYTETRRFFMDSHSGLWRYCRHTKTPNALPTANVVRNFTSIAYVNPVTLMDAKLNASHLIFEEFVDTPLTNFTESAKQRMFAHWVRNDIVEFEEFKKIFEKLVLNTTAARPEIVPVAEKPIVIDPLNVRAIESRKIFGSALKKVMVDSTFYYFVIRKVAQMAIFEGWNEKQYVPKLFGHMYVIWVYRHMYWMKTKLYYNWCRHNRQVGDEKQMVMFISQLNAASTLICCNSEALRNDPSIDLE
ncbi:unnamed protein product [Ceratitis capitata]|uniref:(Mediterranean fruit fly) hypothetical protein n=1 Tax=Ceratitis capitata TaxID=7213 RepID=A0A811VM60_CERCA|nr:unnamed protein product [Ceratitis capitata]